MLPAGFAALLAVGTVTAALHGRLDSTGVLVACAVVVGALAVVAEPTAAVPLGIVGWLTTVGFSRPPYADLRLTGTVAERAAITLAAGCVAAAAPARGSASGRQRVTLDNVDRREPSGIDLRRQLAGAALAVAGLPLLTACSPPFGRTSTSPMTCCFTWSWWSRSPSSAGSGPRCSPRSAPACC